MYNNPYMPQYQPPKKNEINWVQGVAGAKSYPVATNGNAIMLDSERDGIMYIKTSDDIGMCRLRTFQFKEISEEPQSGIDTSQFVTKEELNNILEALKGARNEQPVQRDNRNENKQRG